MRKAPLLIAIAVACAAIVGAGAAALIHNKASAPIADSQTRSPQNSLPIADASTDTSKPTQPAPPKLDDFPHQRIVLKDETDRDPEFAQFRKRLEQAVKNRDAKFVAALIPAKGVAQGFGLPRSAQELKLTNRKAEFWNILEKGLATSCGRADLKSEVSGEGWVCPTVSRDFYQQYPPKGNVQGLEYELGTVIVVGDRVNVRSLPSTDSPVIGVLSNEVVKFDRQRFENSKEEQIEAFNPIDGWTPVILPNDKKGYVYNRYAYQPLEYRLVFQKVKGEWQLVHVPGGD